jgi:small-conductance mechanosensitive channel
MTSVLLALAASIVTAAVLVGAVLTLRRSLTIVRQLTVVLCVGAIAAGLGMYVLAGGPLPAGFEQVFSWLVAFLGAITLLRLIGLYVFDIHLRANRGVQLPPLLAPATQGLAYLLAALVLLRISFPTLNLGPLLATSAVTSLVLGLALQPILGNLFAGIVISLEKPFRLEDWIRVGDVDGRVVEITWRTTHVRTRDNDTLIIPNGRIAEERVVNYYYPNPLHMARVPVGAPYSAPPYRVRRALLECVAGVEGILDKPSPDVYVTGFGDSAISYELRVWIGDVATAGRIKSEVMARIWESFRRHGITIPFPIRTVEFAPRPARASAAGRAPGGRLFVLEGPCPGATVELSERPMVMGRSERADIRLDDVQASKEHARIEWTGAGYAITDLDSSFGTWVNGARVSRCDLNPLDRITIGGSILVMERDDS